jgi:hypothetical protein
MIAPMNAFQKLLTVLEIVLRQATIFTDLIAAVGHSLSLEHAV